MEKITKELKSYETIGYIAGLLTTSSFIPQVFKSYQIMKNNLSNNQKIESEISLYFIFIICIGMVLWIIYGITIYIHAKKENKKTHSGLSIILWNGVSVLFASLVIVFTLKS
tara:strand:+ start:47 stop:382 length:336 start_codon:yes stop_codon:yes gene_type:complete